MTKRRKPIRTLFDPNYRLPGNSQNLPYSMTVTSSTVQDDSRLPDLEAETFSHVAEHETYLYEPRGKMAGLITVRLRGAKAINLEKKGVFPIPVCVEHDALEIVKCNAKGILLIEDEVLFENLCNVKAWAALDLVLVTGCGIPRISVRRLLHRLAEEQNKPVYLLTDNDTWGYFIFSLLKRGMLAPNQFMEPFALHDLRFIGLRAGDTNHLDSSSRYLRPWKDCWDLRLKYLKRYSCFQSFAWKQEFQMFNVQRGAISARTLSELLGLDHFVDHFIKQRIDLKEWLS